MSFLLLFIFVGMCGHVSTSFHVPIRHLHSFVDMDQDALMQHIVVHNRTQEVYVSARNSLYHFDSNLGLKAKVLTGPELDNTLCLHPSHNCTENLTQTDNNNKVLLIYYNVTQDMLLSCGTLYQGICQVRPLDEFIRSSWVGPYDRSVGFVAGWESAVGFFAPGPSSPMSLYVASTYDGRTMEYSPVSVSRRVLSQRDNKFQFYYSHHSDTRFPGVDFDRHKFKRLYKVDYITGFSHGDFSYFLTVQRVSPESVAIETRLARVCHRDPSFSSYIEVALMCNYGLHDMYNMASAAILEPSSPHLKLEDSTVDAVLYVAFLKTVRYHGKLVDRPKGSVVCSFPMSQVVRYFTNATRDCFHAKPKTHLLKHVTGVDLKCSPHEDVQVDDSFCGSGFNNFVEGLDAIPGEVRTHLDAYVTSLAVTLQREKTVAFMGTDQGGVVKVVLEQLSSQPLYNINIANETEGQSLSKAIQRQNAFDSSHDNIYFLTSHKVIKFPIGSCSVYRDCVSCLRIDDPLACGWCGSYCAHLEECETPDLFSTNSCRPVIYNVYPLSGPTAGKTMITILGDNFRSSQTGQLNSGIHVFAAGEKCEIVQWEKERIDCKTSAVSMPKSGPILVNISDVSWLVGEFHLNGPGSSSQNFSYVVPKMYGIQPSYGPISGGTNITIYGEKLNIGAKHNITVNRVPCSKFRVFENTSWCITGRFPDSWDYSNWQRPSRLVEVEIDNAIIEYTFHPELQQHLVFEFQYRPDPQIKSIYPQITSLSGTTNLTVYGIHLDSVAHPKMVVIVTSSLMGPKLEFEQPCSKICENGTKMMCSTPPLNISGLYAPTAMTPLVTHVAFIMDGVGDLRDLPLHDQNLSQLLYYPDPEYFIFHEKDGVKLLSAEDSLLEIQGKNLDLSHSPLDIKVLIGGDKICNVTSVSEDKLYCVLPPMSADSSDNLTQHSVDVILGPLTFHLGYVKLVDFQVDSLLLGLIIAIVIGFFLVLLCVGIFMRHKLCLCFKKRKIHHPEYIGEQIMALVDFHTSRPADTEAKALTAVSAIRTMHMTIQQQETFNLELSENFFIYKKDLTFGAVIRQGHFGHVYRGNLKTQEGEIAVAIKTLNKARDVEAFIQEVLRMKDLRNNNVLKLIGVCCERNSLPIVITPYMINRDLFSYLRKEEISPKVGDLLRYSFQIALGMEYLSKIKFVHRNLAARNCLLDDNYTVKVADFGLSRDICEQDSYSNNHNIELPMKWMAPESLENGSFNTKTDVWSYGVVLWELMTRCITPYPEVDNYHILFQNLKSGKRMPQPSHCPDLLYKIMQQCWRDNAEQRPTFTELRKEVHEVISKGDQNLLEQIVGLDIHLQKLTKTTEAQ